MARDRVCRDCGCTDARACPGGCTWVFTDLCSRCAEAHVTGGQDVPLVGFGDEYDDDDDGDAYG
jgi:hypothetical protein